MACFLVPAGEAVVTTIAAKVMEKKEQREDQKALEHGVALHELKREHFSAKLKRLNGFLWGGSALLAFEHVWHGEVQPFFPFLTAASDAVSAAEMLQEMATTGVGMAVLATVVWGALTLTADKLERRDAAASMNDAEVMR